MTVLSTQRSQALKQRLAQFSKIYAAHRPAVQRSLNIAFVFYVLGSTYLSLSGGPRKGAGDNNPKKGKNRAKKGELGKPVKVAVSGSWAKFCFVKLKKALHGCVGRCGVLPSTGEHFADCNSRNQVKGSLAFGYALQPACVPHGNLTLCSCIGWKVGILTA